MNNTNGILLKSKTIAVVGFSLNPERPSNRIARYLKLNGYNVFGINPNVKVNSFDGILCFSSLDEIPVKADIINVFRRSEFAKDAVDEAVKMKEKPELIWLQSGVMNEEAKQTAMKHGIEYVENKCIMTEHQKLILKI